MDVVIADEVFALRLREFVEDGEGGAQALQVGVDQLFVDGEGLTVDAAAQCLVLDLVKFFEVEIVHHRPSLEGDALLLVAGEEDLTMFDDLEFEKEGGLIEDQDIDCIGVEPFGEFAEEVHLVVEELVGFDLVHQEDGDIDIAELSKGGTGGEVACEVGGIDGILREELVETSLLLE